MERPDDCGQVVCPCCGNKPAEVYFDEDTGTWFITSCVWDVFG
jgi:hypothetical protein